MRRGFLGLVVMGFVVSQTVSFAQTVTISHASGFLFGAGQNTHFGLEGLDLSLDIPTFHEQGHRDPYLLGLKANIAVIPDGIAGNRFGIGGYATTPLSFINQFFDEVRFSLQFSTGFGFYDKPREKIDNPSNQYIGSYLNCVIDIGPVVEIPMLYNDQFLILGFKFVHNSNGYLKKPNVGLNYLQCELGWRFPSEVVGINRAPSSLSYGQEYDPVSSFFIAGAPGISVPRSSRADNTVFYPAYSLQLGYRFVYHKVRAIDAAIDFTYNFADDFDYVRQGRGFRFPLFVGTTLLHETYWGPFSMVVGIGYYIFQSFPDGKIYERAGVRYHFGRMTRQSVGIIIKANSTHADFIEWTYTVDI